MLQDIVEARMLGGFRVHIRFEDGVEGEVDLGRLIRFEGVFAQLRDPKSSPVWPSIRKPARFAGQTAQTWIPTSCMPSFPANPFRLGKSGSRWHERLAATAHEVVLRHFLVYFVVQELFGCKLGRRSEWHKSSVRV